MVKNYKVVYVKIRDDNTVTTEDGDIIVGITTPPTFYGSTPNMFPVRELIVLKPI
jgi:hypothetical protein